MTAPALQTAERRARRTRPPLPGLRAVLLEQVRATRIALRGAAMIVAAILVSVTLVVALQGVSMGAVLNLYEWPTMMPGVMGALLPIAVWARDERFGPGFIWTLPVDRRRHAFAKVLAGWVWLMGGVAIVALWLLVLSLVSGGRVLPPETVNVLTSEFVGGPLDAATLREVGWAPGPQIWAVPFTAASASYLLASAVALGSRHPLRWVIGTALSYAFLSVVTDAASTQLKTGWLADAPARALHLLVEGRYGLDAVLTARTATLNTTVFLTTGERAVVWRAVPDIADWRTATLFWTGAGLLALWAATSRHRERRRA
jgi:hypothetical protein